MRFEVFAFLAITALSHNDDASSMFEAANQENAVDVIGYYSWNWGAGSKPSGSNAGIAFTGYTDVPTAISGYTPGCSWCCPTLVGYNGGKPWMTIGGGNSAGIFDAPSLRKVIQDLHLVTG